MDTLNAFVTLFRGRADCYGSWDGGCVKEKLTQDTFRRHLLEGPHIGVYPSFNVEGQAHCVWGCTDIDYDDYDEARRLQAAFAAVDVVAWTEKTRKGWHIWVFATELVPAVDMRNMFLAAHQVANSKPKEVNPKQTVLAWGQVGNYVRLPYPGGNKATERVVIGAQTQAPMSLDVFVEAAVDKRTAPSTIADLATYYTPPAAPAAVVTAPTNDMTQAARLLTPLGRTMWRHGPIEGRDRSTTLAHLAHECWKAQLPTGDALMLLEDADLRWGKYMTRGPKGHQELVKLVERAYGPTRST